MGGVVNKAVCDCVVSVIKLVYGVTAAVLVVPEVDGVEILDDGNDMLVLLG